MAVNHVEYYQEHKEVLTAKSRQYYSDNKEIIAEKKSEKFDCACGGKYTRTNKAQHEKSLRHIKSLEINEIII